MLDLWPLILQYGVPFLLFLGVAALYTGRVESQKAVDRLETSSRERFNEMQKMWRERYDEVSKDRDYWRSIATQINQQTQQTISMAEVATGSSGQIRAIGGRRS